MSLRFALELMFMPPAQFGKKSSPAAVGFTPRVLTVCSRDRVSIPRVNSGALACRRLYVEGADRLF